jgi:hypothetical protein
MLEVMPKIRRYVIQLVTRTLNIYENHVVTQRVEKAQNVMVASCTNYVGMWFYQQ